jgi:hypothetical protein
MFADVLFEKSRALFTRQCKFALQWMDKLPAPGGMNVRCFQDATSVAVCFRSHDHLMPRFQHTNHRWLIGRVALQAILPQIAEHAMHIHGHNFYLCHGQRVSNMRSWYYVSAALQLLSRSLMTTTSFVGL